MQKPQIKPLQQTSLIDNTHKASGQGIIIVMPTTTNKEVLYSL